MPWGRVDDTYYDHPKLELLTGEREWPDRLAAAGLNALAWSWCNRFLTDGHVPTNTVTKLGATLDLAEILVGVGLWETAPHGFQIHDFLVYNDSREQVLERRAKEAKRKAEWRMSHRDKNRLSGPDDDGPAGTSNGSRPNVPPSVPPSVPAGQRDVSRDSTRANPDPSRPVPTRPTESLKRGSRAPARVDVAALIDRGFKRVTAKQRAVLDEIAGRHDATGHAFAAEAIRVAPEGTDPLEAAMTADRLWQESRRRQLDAEDAAWAKTKEQERLDAERIAAAPPDWLQPKVPA